MSENKDIFQKVIPMTQLAGIFLLFITMVGFIVVNIYLGQFGYFEYSLFQTKFISAGLLFLWPLTFSVAIISYIVRIKKLFGQKLYKLASREFFYLVLFYIFFIFTNRLILPDDGETSSSIWQLFYLNTSELNFFILFWLMFSAVTAISLKRYLAAKTNIAHLAVAFMTVIFLLYFFSVTYLKNVYPWFGGMHSTVGKVVFNDPSIQLTGSGFIEILYQDDKYILIKVTGGEIFAFPTNSIKYIQFDPKGYRYTKVIYPNKQP